MNTRRFLGIRRWLSAVGILSILSSLVIVAPIASAYSGADATSAGFSWAATAVDEACDKGLIDCDLADPAFGQTVTRAVAYQMLTAGFGVLNENAMSPFADVSEDDWFAAAFHTAYTLGWTAGVGTNDDGAPLSGYGQDMTRTQLALAASKGLGLECEDEAVLDEFADGGDIRDWGREAVCAMVEAELMVGSMKDGKKWFMPNEGANKAQVIVVMNAQVDYAAENEIDVLEVAAAMLDVDVETLQQALDEGMNVVDGQLVAVGEADDEDEDGEGDEDDEDEDGDEGEGEDEGDGEVLPAANVTVASSDYVQKSPVLSGSANSSFLKLAVTSDVDAKMTALNVRRGGASKDNYINAVKVYDAAGKQHGPAVTMGSTGARVSFPGDPIMLMAGVPMMVEVKLNTTTDATTGSLQLWLQDASDVTVVGTDGTTPGAVAGTFPLMGKEALLTSSTGLLGTLTADVVNGYTANLDVGSREQIITILRLSATANEAVRVTRLLVTQNGSGADSDTANWTLKDDAGAQWGPTVVAPVNKMIEFIFEQPLELTQGTSKNLTLRADIVGGSSRTVQATIQNDYDIDAVGVQTNFGVLASADAGGTDTSFPIGLGSGTDFNQHTVSSGSLALAKATSTPTTKVTKGALTDVAVFELTASGEDMELREVYVGYDGSVATAGSVVSLGVYNEASIALASQASSLAADGTQGGNYSYSRFVLSPYVSIRAGDKYKLKVKANLASSSYTTGNTFRGAINGLVYKRITRGDIVTLGSTSTTAAALNASGVAANTLTVSETSLAAAANSSLSAQQLVVGQNNAKLGSWILTAGEAEGVNISSLTVGTCASGNTYGATNTNAFGDGYITSVTLKKVKADGTEENVGQISAAPTSSSTFNASGLSVAPSDTVVFNVYGSVSSSTTNISNNDVLCLSLAATGSGSNSGTSLTAAAQNGQSNTVSTAGGSLAVQTEATTPAARVLHSNENATDVLYARLTSSVEDVRISKVTLGVAGGVNQMASGGLTLWNGTAQIGTAKTLTLDANGASAHVTFDGLNFSVVNNVPMTLTVKARTSNGQTMFGNQYFVASIDDLEATGDASGLEITPTVALTTAASLGTPVDTAAAVTVTNNSGFSIGDAVVAFNTTDGVEPGLVTATSGSTSVTVASGDDMTAAASRVTRLSTAKTTSASAGQPLVAGTATTTVTSSTGFKLGDVVFVGNTTNNDGTSWGMVTSAVVAQNGLVISPKADADFDGAVATRVSKLPTLATTACTGGILLVTGAVAATGCVTDGFQVGDPVVAYNTTDGVEFGMVVSIDSSTAMKIAVETNTTAAVTRVSRIAGPVSTAASAGIPLVGGAAVTVSSNLGFNIGDAVFVFNATDGVELGIVTAVSGSTSMTVATAANMTAAAARVTKLASAGAVSRPMLVEGVEPDVSSGFANATAAPNADQVVADFVVAAAGDRPLVINELNFVKSGSNSPERYVTAFDLYTGTGASLGQKIGAISSTNVAGTTDADGGDAATTRLLCNDAATAATGEIGGFTDAETTLVQPGDRFTIRDGTNTATVTVLRAAGTNGACGGASTFSVTFDSSVTTADAATVSFDAFSVHFDSTASTVFPEQQIPAGSALGFTVKSNTSSVRTGVTQGSVTFNLQLPGATSAEESVTNGILWKWTDGKPTQTTYSSLNVSDEYPFTFGTLTY